MADNRDLNYNPLTDRDRNVIRKDLTKQEHALGARINLLYADLARIEGLVGEKFINALNIDYGNPGHMNAYNAVSAYNLLVNAVSKLERTQLDIMEKLVGPDFETLGEEKKENETDKSHRRLAERCLNELAQKYLPPGPSTPST